VTIQQYGAEDMNFLHGKTPLVAKIDAVADIERVEYKQKDNAGENIM
jgi:hypothetical protein